MNDEALRLQRIREIYEAAKKDAAERGVNFGLTRDEVLEIYKLAGGKPDA